MARLAAPPPAGDPLRAGPAADHVEHMRAVYERVRGERPGMLDRPGPWWEGRLYDPESRRQGAQPLQALVVPDGYALYAVRPGRDDEGPAGEVDDPRAGRRRRRRRARCCGTSCSTRT